MIRVHALGLLTVAFAPALFATPPSEAIHESQVRAHLDFLASDLLEGRDSGYRGGEIAAKYLESQFLTLGLSPLPDMAFQWSFELRGAAGRAKVNLRLNGSEHSDPKKVEAINDSALGAIQGSVTTPEGDPTGKIVVLTEAEDAEASRAACEELFTRGAKGVVLVSGKDSFESRGRGDGRRRPNPKPKESEGSAPEQKSAGGGALAEFAAFAAAHAPLAETRIFSGPVVRVAKELGVPLRETADSGGSVDLSVTREGVNESTNVIGMLEGSDPALRSEYVVIGAHYDHVGKDEQGNIWNGADDNASGTVAVLSAATALARSEVRPKRSVVFCLWGAEERGLVGSQAFVGAKKLNAEKIHSYINLDMVGRNDANSIFGLHVSQDLFDLARRCGSDHGLDVTSGAAMYLSMSDSKPFIDVGVPTLFLFSGLHDDYHTPADDPGTVDYGKITKVAQTALDMLISLGNDDPSQKPRFDDSSTLKPDNDNDRKLGFFPDTDAKEEGVTVRSVSGRGVAAKAGIRAADRIIRIADKPVKDMRSMREALTSRKDDEAFEVEVIRDGKPTVLSAVFTKAKEEAKSGKSQ